MIISFTVIHAQFTNFNIDYHLRINVQILRTHMEIDFDEVIKPKLSRVNLN